jgi:hypothetical protein
LSQTPRYSAASKASWRQGDGRGHGDDVAREQRQLHARTALGDAVAHGRHAAGELGGGPDLARGDLDQRGIFFQRLVGRQHVVIGRDDRHRRLLLLAQLQLVVGREGGETVRQVRARQRAALHALDARGVQMGQVSLARMPAAFDDPIGHLLYYGMYRHDRSS